MATGLVYEGDGFLRTESRATESRPGLRTKAAEVETEALAPSAAEVEQRARALRREYLNDWLFWLLDR